MSANKIYFQKCIIPCMNLIDVNDIPWPLACWGLQRPEMRNEISLESV